MGGWIAYAVAQELVRQGCAVAWLGLVDTHATSVLPIRLRARILLPFLWSRLGVHWRGWWDLSWRERANYLRARWNSAYYHWLRMCGWAHADMPPGIGMRDPEADLNPDWQDDPYNVASQRYRPEPYSGDVHLFTLQDTPEYHYAFWPGLLRGRTFRHRIEGDHLAIIQDPAHRIHLVHALRQALTQAPRDAR